MLVTISDCSRRHDIVTSALFFRLRKWHPLTTRDSLHTAGDELTTCRNCSIIANSSCRCRCSCSSRSTTAATETAEFGAKLSACDQIHEEVVDEYETIQHETYIVYWLVAYRRGPHVTDVEDGPSAAEEYIYERSGDQHYGRNGGVGGAGLLRLVTSEGGGSSVGRLTYFMHNQQVNHENCRR